ncbi:nitrilotriacetate monooxygenase subunit A [Chitiniphilus shinanonensis]|uniref:Nitrilotriacetate monooxygenase subunit A n=1 Tax=Chitiniphilus shinanonensis TaxID=553088 RepID=A0ABQ6BVY9_9NEIS|nr:LLM class flavin-dependent oxidoreductase [Chitiniphilus shinanonensis]GLS05552.1 nitrilotriacetate monooxygenase subunit A [Chitiniphilus shinanonensis]
MSQRKIRLGAFIPGAGHHVAAWRHPEAQADGAINLAHYVRLAQTAERGLFDTLFLADGLAAGYGATAAAEGKQAWGGSFEPVTLFSALSVVTERIGFVATASTTYEDPFILARKFASLDHLSAGRAGWNVVTTGSGTAAGNFGLAQHPAHADRYDRAREFVDVVKGLWDSWEDDAFVRDQASGQFYQPAKRHELNHAGKHFAVRGPLNVPRPPQGHPVIVQAGSSDTGKEFAAETAEVIFTAQQTLEEARAFYADVKGRLAHHGRRPEQLLIMPGVFAVVGRTEEEAQRKYEELQALILPEVGLSLLSNLAGGVDLSRYDLDGPVPELPETENMKSRQALMLSIARQHGFTIRQLYLWVAGARGHWTVVGSVEQVADQLQSWFEQGAADGFNVMPPWLPGGLDDFVELVVPELQRRGLFRTAYEGHTLRDNLGLARPDNRFVATATAAREAAPALAAG